MKTEEQAVGCNRRQPPTLNLGSPPLAHSLYRSPINLMTIAPEIRHRVQADAGDLSEEMLARLNAFAVKHPDLGDRILRCLVFLAQGKLDRLGFAIQTAESDWRDTIVQAEYEPRPGTKRFQGDFIQVRDFNQPFA